MAQNGQTLGGTAASPTCLEMVWGGVLSWLLSAYSALDATKHNTLVL